MTISLFALAVCAFAIGCTEFVVIGILPLLAPEFHISIASAGHLVTWYACAVIVGAPLIPAITSRMPRKTLLIFVIALFLIGNLTSAIAVHYNMVILGRILAGLAHGTFFAVSSNVAIHLVSKEKQATALAIMFSGLTVALVTGVPLGTFLATGFSWRVPFFFITAVAFLGCLSLLFFLPHVDYQKPKHIFGQFEILANPKMLLAYAITVLSFGGPFIAYTFIAAILRSLTGFSQYWVGGILILFGIAVAFGNIWGGKLSDRKGPLHTLTYFVLTIIAVLILFYFTQYYKVPAVLLIIVWGFASFAICPALQILVMDLAKQLKFEGADVAAGLNIAAFNLGIAGGSFIGSAVVSHWGLAYTSLAGILPVFISLFLIWRAIKQFRIQ